MRNIPSVAVDVEGCYQRLVDIIGQFLGRCVGRDHVIQRHEDAFALQQARAFDRNVDNVRRLAARNLGHNFVGIFRPCGDRGEVIHNRDIGMRFCKTGVGVGIDFLIGVAAKVENRKRDRTIRRRGGCATTGGGRLSGRGTSGKHCTGCCHGRKAQHSAAT